MTALNTLTAVEAAAKIGRGDISSEALVKACLERIAAREPEVKAFTYLDPARALEQARAADQAGREGRGLGPLHGVPIAIKDIIDTADMPTENGSPVFKDRRPEADAACVAALRQAGAIIIGKTVTAELATLTPGVTRNPRNLAHTPGGSSSGSAAAVADEMVPLALGTQTGGSVIRPASFCGIYGFKPTYGLIPRPGVLDQAHSLDTIGVYGRSIEDLALLTDVLAFHDGRDQASLNISQSSLLAQATAEWKVKPMFAFVKSAAWDDADAVTKEAFGELVETLGGQVEEVGLDESTRAGAAAQKVINDAELAAQFGPLLKRTPELISARLTKQIENGLRLTAAEYLNALDVRKNAYWGLEDIFRSYGTILTPAAPGPAPKGLESTGVAIFNAYWTMMGTPCVSLPLLEADGLPIGVQLVGARRDDGRLLRNARLLVRQLAE
jgi:Asp-tRNA(Asn)/Glu-tRNA(Gln) amidotransferase A subunit family amidase